MNHHPTILPFNNLMLLKRYRDFLVQPGRTIYAVTPVTAVVNTIPRVRVRRE